MLRKDLGALRALMGDGTAHALWDCAVWICRRTGQTHKDRLGITSVPTLAS